MIIQFTKGDHSVNPNTTAILRAGDLADLTTYYRHDLAFREIPGLPINSHGFAPTSPPTADLSGRPGASCRLPELGWCRDHPARAVSLFRSTDRPPIAGGSDLHHPVTAKQVAANRVNAPEIDSYVMCKIVRACIASPRAREIVHVRLTCVPEWSRRTFTALYGIAIEEGSDGNPEQEDNSDLRRARHVQCAGRRAGPGAGCVFRRAAGL
jgi:hypothetical protein